MSEPLTVGAEKVAPSRPMSARKPAVRAFEESQTFYNAGYAAGRRGLSEQLVEWLRRSGDQGDHEFGWKDAVRAQLGLDPTPRS